MRISRNGLATPIQLASFEFQCFLGWSESEPAFYFSHCLLLQWLAQQLA